MFVISNCQYTLNHQSWLNWLNACNACHTMHPCASVCVNVSIAYCIMLSLLYKARWYVAPYDFDHGMYQKYRRPKGCFKMYCVEISNTDSGFGLFFLLSFSSSQHPCEVGSVRLQLQEDFNLVFFPLPGLVTANGPLLHIYHSSATPLFFKFFNVLCLLH